MSNDTFASPAAAGGGFAMRDHLGSLLLIEVFAAEDGIVTVNGPASAIRGTVAVLDGEHKGEVHEDTLIWGKVLQGQLRTRVGQKVLGRVAQGNQKPGQSPPWVLLEATDADRAVGSAYLAGQISTPTASSAAPF